MIRLSLLVLALVMGVSLSVASIQAMDMEKGATEAKKPALSTMMGTVKSVGESSFVVAAGGHGDGQETTITVNADTKYAIHDKEVTMAEVVKVGARVKIAHKDGLAITVYASKPKPETKKVQ